MKQYYASEMTKNPIWLLVTNVRYPMVFSSRKLAEAYLEENKHDYIGIDAHVTCVCLDGDPDLALAMMCINPELVDLKWCDYSGELITDADRAVIERMDRYGGSFVKMLAQLFLLADPINFARLKLCFRDYWRDYESWVEVRNSKE